MPRAYELCLACQHFTSHFDNDMQFVNRKLFLMDHQELYGQYDLYGP